jgi:hypothetical protein
MKKIIFLFLVLCFIFMFSACNTENVPEEIHSFTATVLDVWEESILVESDSQYVVSLPDGADEIFAVGDIVVVEFRYPIAETYPMLIQDVVAVYSVHQKP